MHHVFAIQPELLPEWSADIRTFSYFFESFGPDTGRLVARFPKHWHKLVEPHLAQLSGQNLIRAVELRKRLGAQMVRRRGSTWSDRDWLRNAIEEHARQPFRAILATENPSSNPDVLVAAAIHPGESRWELNRAAVISHTTMEIVNCARTLIEASTEVLLVDPYFDPQFPRWRDVLEGLFTCAPAIGSPAARFQYHVDAGRATAKEFAEDCDELIAGLIPAWIEFKIFRWERFYSGDKPHARYILTERGGIHVERGLDDTPGLTTDVRILEEPIWRQRWEELREGTPYPYRLADTWAPPSASGTRKS